jgi:hypothetical protein
MIHHDEDVNKENDRLIQHYDTILKEIALLATFAGILFGFLLQISINTPRYFTYFDKAILLVALFSITIAASLFAMPKSSSGISLQGFRKVQGKKPSIYNSRFDSLRDYIISRNSNCTWISLDHGYGICSGCDTIHYCIYIF